MPVVGGLDDAKAAIIGDAGASSGSQTMRYQSHGLVVDAVC